MRLSYKAFYHSGWWCTLATMLIVIQAAASRVEPSPFHIAFSCVTMGLGILFFTCAHAIDLGLKEDQAKGREASEAAAKYRKSN